MKNFFTGRLFRVVASLVAILLAVSILFTVMGHYLPPQTGVLGTVLSPFQKISASVTQSVDRFFTAVARTDRLEEENNRLREEIRSNREQLIDYDSCKQENEFFKQFLTIKEQNSDFAFQPATVTARDGGDVCGSFSVDVGTRDGVALHDPVITADGLVGYISQIGSTMATVVTVADPRLKVGAVVSRTRESGVASGDAELMADGYAKLSYLPANSAVTIGDYVITSGAGGLFPKGLLIGTVEDVKKQQANVSLYAVLKPVVDVNRVSRVMIITDFEGQGGIADDD